MNFVPKMDREILIKKQKDIVTTIYSHHNYYERVRAFLKEYKSPIPPLTKIRLEDIFSLLKSIWVLGIKENGKTQYWRFFGATLFKHPRRMPIAISFAIYGYHFRKIAEACN